MWSRLCLDPGVLGGPPRRAVIRREREHAGDSGDWHFLSLMNGETFWKNHNRSRT